MEAISYMECKDRSTNLFVQSFIHWLKHASISTPIPKISRGRILNHEFVVTERKNTFLAEILRKQKTFSDAFRMGRWIHRVAMEDDRYMIIKELKEYIIRPALTQVGMWSASAENLLAGTIMIESGGERLKQVKGPALGLYQIEPKTHKDVKRELDREHDKELKAQVLAACGMVDFPFDDALVWNLRYATIIARLLYRRDPSPLPDSEDAEGLAKTHKNIYNTVNGKADVRKSVEVFKRVIDNE
jgi:hypothetical protein